MRLRQQLGCLADVQADTDYLIAARGGVDGMYANDPGKLRACNKWVNAARPVIRAMFALEDAQGPLINARLDDPTAFGPYIKRSPLVRDAEAAQDIIEGARKELFAMLDGIRDDFIADERVGCCDDPDEQEEADEFNDWLSDNTISVDAAIRLIAREGENA